MSGIMSQLIIIQPTMERVALSYRKSPRNALQHHSFCKTLKVLGKIWKDFNRGCRNQKWDNINQNRFSARKKLLLILATVVNLIYRAKKNRSSKCQYTKDDVLVSNFSVEGVSKECFLFNNQCIKKKTKVGRQEQIEKLESNNWPKRTPTI